VAAFVPGVVCLAVIPIALLFLIPPQVRETPDAVLLAKRELAAIGPISSNEIIMATIFVGLIVMWVFGEQIGIGATQAAAIGVSLMLLTGVLSWQDALAEKSAWDTMIWIAILIMLASKLNEYGLIAWLGDTLGTYLKGYHRFVVGMLVVAIYFYSHYLFASATAHISALFPVSLTLLIGAGLAPLPAAMLLAAMSNLYGCLTQYAIGSGPVMFGAGYVTQGEWWRTGFFMSLIYLAIWFTIGPIWWALLGLTYFKF